MNLPIIGGAYQSNSKAISAQEAVNCYVEAGRGVSNALVGVHGYVEYVDLGAPIRGLHNAWGVMYAVAGSNLYKIVAGTATLLGNVGSDGLKADISHNIFELLVLSGGNGYVAQKSDTFSAVTDTDFPDASVCDFLDGYGMLLEKKSGRFHFTTINDFETISGIDFATAEGAPDDTVSLLVDHRELWLFGERTIEIWYNVSASSNPFQRREGAFIERGCRGTYSPAKVDNTVFWLGNDNIIYRADGVTPKRVSNHGIENLINKTTVDPIGSAYNWEGHAFYQLTFPGELTVVYDASTDTLHTRKTQTRLDSGTEHHVQIGTTHYMGGPDGKIYRLDENNYQFGGDELPRFRAVGPLRTRGYSTMSEATFVFETGENTDPLNESEVFLEISDDGGRTFSNRIQGSIGKQGQYKTEVKFLALGGYYDNERVMRIGMTGNARFTLIDAWAA